MSTKLHVSSSPHIRSRVRTEHIMFAVVLALLPAAVYGVWLNGPNALMLLLVSVATAVATEALYEKITGRPVTISDGSAILTGLLLGMNLPPLAPFWLPVIGSSFAILVVKQFFGGLGQNFMNPALAGRAFLLISFAARMTDFSVSSRTAEKIVDTVSGATPLAAIKAGETGDLISMFFGNTRGTIGETSALLLLVGGLFLVFIGVIRIHIPAIYIATFAVFALIFGGHGFDMRYLATEICGGGLMLGAFFMATDYVTRPITVKGQCIYAVMLGVLTGIFRIFGGSGEGVSYAIILTNCFVPLLEKATLPRGFGIPKEKKEKKEKGGQEA